MSIQAANPKINATVTASAGSGKTYMLVTRILRLLLDGAEPGSILALTFTRKAAAEMQQRLAERLYQLATVEQPQLEKLLKELDLGREHQQRARTLYEDHQYCDYPVRTLTFHSFCQELLSRFPLEAQVPPGFNLLESSELLIQQASDALFNEAALQMQGELARHLYQLMQYSGGLFNLNKVLNQFLQHRSDWWAYTDGQANALDFAAAQLAQTLEISPEDDPLGPFFSPRLKPQLSRFAALLVRTEGKKNLQAADALADWLVEQQASQQGFLQIKACFLTQKNEALKTGRTDNKSLRSKLGEDADEFLELHERLSQQVLDTLEHINRHHTWKLNYHWFYCGEKLLEHYSLLKQQQRLLDFTDLEWRSYKLLQDSDNALWVQYKLDQQINHLLIDEFQDTNPTQWQLMLPLLEEMAASESQQARSVFLVGDEKQSIYSFRRAKPELQQQASHWLGTHLNAQAFPLNKSWRSSPAIINTVNEVFAQAEFKLKLPGFQAHQTHHQTLPGKVEVLPLWRSDELEQQTPEAIYCRNPLEQPRAENSGLHRQEAQQISQHIKQLVAQGTTVHEGDRLRAVNYNDIFILVRKRAHVADYERALREAGIAYLGTNRGTFLSCLEVQDMLALLDTLLTPFNNLALAQVLKSPIFNASDHDLQLLASHNQQTHWYDRLESLAQNLAETRQTDHPLYTAWNHLTGWRALTDHIPVHDLVDKIFADADVMSRYHKATPKPLRPRVKANLTLFLEMALDLDSGRYPSLMHFLYVLRSLHNTPGDAPDEAPMQTREPRVRIMTIHASKGLEAPVVYLADTLSVERDKSSLSPLVDWPVQARQPLHFQLLPPAQQADQVSADYNQRHKANLQKEDANLLYVALTRARQYLFISGCQPARGQFNNWYQPVYNALQELTGQQDEAHLIYTYGEVHNSRNLASTAQGTGDISRDNTDKASPPPGALSELELALSRPLATPPRTEALIAPSYTPSDPANKESAPSGQAAHADTEADTDEDAQQRGIIIHRLLELLSRNGEVNQASIVNQVHFELGTQHSASPRALIEEAYTLASELIEKQELAMIFHPPPEAQCYNECPLQFPLHHPQGQRQVYGIIDRLIIDNDRAIIVDYKTHQQANPQTRAFIANRYRQQMSLYTQGISLLWPDKRIETYLLFTEDGFLYSMDEHN